MKFETFLRRKFLAAHPETVDEDEGFDTWLVRLDAQEWLDLAEMWGEELSNEVREAHKHEN